MLHPESISNMKYHLSHSLAGGLGVRELDWVIELTSLAKHESRQRDMNHARHSVAPDRSLLSEGRLACDAVGERYGVGFRSSNCAVRRQSV